jgi:hypothetical protein
VGLGGLSGRGDRLQSGQADDDSSAEDDTAKPAVQIVGLSDGQVVSGAVAVEARTNVTPEYVHLVIPGVANRYDRSPPYSLIDHPQSVVPAWDTTAVQDGDYTLTVTVMFPDRLEMVKTLDFQIKNTPDPEPGDDGDDEGDGGDGEDGEDDADDGATGGDNPYANRPELDEDGWTILNPSEDSRIIYVSSSEGDDANDGLSPETPIQTIAKGVWMLRDGYPDWLMLKAGDIWNEGIRAWGNTHGRSESEPIVLTSYGEGPRPKLLTANEEVFKRAGSNPIVRHIAFVGLHFKPDKRDPSDPNFVLGEERYPGGWTWLGPGGDVLIEDCVIEKYKDNIIIQGGPSGIKIRRNIIIDAWGKGSHAQGIFAKDVNGLLIEENIFDHNGYHDLVDGADRTIFSHNMYLTHGNEDVTVRGNVSSRAAAHGLQLRSGGLCEDNLFIRNGLAMYNRGTTRRNVVMESDDIAEDLPRGHGMHARFSDPNGPKHIDVDGEPDIWERNIVLNRIGSLQVAGIEVGDSSFSVGTDPLVVRDNVVQNWNNNSGEGIEIVSAVPAEALSAIALESNIVDGMMRETGETVTFMDGDRDLNSYMQSLGYTGGFDKFIELHRSRSSGQWNPALSAAAFGAYMRSGFTPTPNYD